MPDTRPEFSVDVVSNGTQRESDREYAARFYGLCERSGEVFRRGTTLWVCNRRTRPRAVLDAENLGHIVRNSVRLTHLNTKTGQLEDAGLPYETAGRLFNSEEILRLPEVKAIIHEPAIYFENDEPRICSPGWNPGPGIYYWLPATEEPITPRAGVTYLTQCFSGVPFAAPGYRANVIAWLLGGLIIDRRFSSPLLVITGNQRGIGKTKTQEALGYLLTGQQPVPINPSPTEFEKQLGSRFSAGDRFIALDNITTQKGSGYKNDALARHLTNGWSTKVRVLGHSRDVEQTGCLFTLTANDAKVDEDLATRTLICDLYADEPKEMVPFVVREAQTRRREIIGELLNLALSVPRFSMIPSGIHTSFRYRAWLSFVLPAIQPYFGDLKIDESVQCDEAYIDLMSFGADHLNTPYTSTTLHKELQDAGDKFTALRERILKPSTKGQIAALGRVLARSVGRAYTLSPDERVVLKSRVLHGVNYYLFEIEKVEVK